MLANVHGIKAVVGLSLQNTRGYRRTRSGGLIIRRSRVRAPPAPPKFCCQMIAGQQYCGWTWAAPIRILSSKGGADTISTEPL